MWAPSWAAGPALVRPTWMLGLLEPVSPCADCPAVLARALTAGADTAKQNMETALKAGGLAPVVNGWTLTFHMFDYNLDHPGPGTIDDQAWRIGDRDASYLARALAARAGLWGNHGYEAAYPMTYTEAAATSSTGATGTPCGWTRTRPSKPSGPSPCTTCRTSTWSPTRSTGIPSATARPACAAIAMGRSLS